MGDFFVNTPDLRLHRPTEPVAEVPDRGIADLLVAELEAEGVRTNVVPVKPLCGVHSAYVILVPPREAHRARRILRDTELADRELLFLATGELTPEEDR